MNFVSLLANKKQANPLQIARSEGNSSLKMAGKTTSAGYRIPVSSEYHQKCIAQSMKTIREAAARTINTDKNYSQGEYRKCNAVAQEKLWKEYVHNEIRTAKEWYAEM